MRTPKSARSDPFKSNPPVTGPKKQAADGIDIDDASIEEPKDDAFRKVPPVPDKNNTVNRLPERDNLSQDVERREGPDRRR